MPVAPPPEPAARPEHAAPWVAVAAAPVPAPAPDAPDPPAATPPARPAAADAADADADDDDDDDAPSLHRSSRARRRATGHSFRALSVEASYQLDSTGEGASAAELSAGILPDDTRLGGVELGVEAVAAGALVGGAFDSGTAGVHGWVSPGPLDIGLYAVAGLAGHDAPEHAGPNLALQLTAAVEYGLGPLDQPWLTLGVAAQLDAQSRARIGDPAGASTYVAGARTLGGSAGASLTLLYGPPGSATEEIPRLEIWTEIAAARTRGDRTSTSPLAGPAVLRPDGEHRELLATAGVTVNVPLGGSAHRVLSAGLLGGLHPQRDTVGGAADSSTTLLAGVELGYASRF